MLFLLENFYFGIEHNTPPDTREYGQLAQPLENNLHQSKEIHARSSSAGREENSVPLFTPPQTHPVEYSASAYEEAAVQASLQSDASGLSLLEIQNAEGIADVLMEMLRVLDPKNPQNNIGLCKGNFIVEVSSWWHDQFGHPNQNQWIKNTQES
ncbi:Target of Myb protein 1 [Forsythia ovata]|uniref:Target of Myb protein 1 n=1 Tax=Forsythia ovata TaxID=205694 RepID=A0ABD1U5A4_9LAMI